MLDSKFILANLEKVGQAIAEKRAGNAHTDLAEFAQLDQERRSAQTENDKLAAEKNKLSKQVGPLMGRRKQAGGAEAAKLDAEIAGLQDASRALDDQIMTLAVAFATADARMNEMRAWIPNVPHESVPPGADAAANAVVREGGGAAKKFEFKPRYHYELGADLEILDCERGAKVAGSGWYFLRGDGARLERALVAWFLDVHRTRHGYLELFPPFCVTEKTLFGSGQLPKFAGQYYTIPEDGLLAIPTAEVPLTAYHRDEILEARELPKKYCAYSACFRREAGAAGADTRGILRVHQFNKVELLKLATPETSWDELEQLTADAEYLLQQLGLKYRIVNLCRGDLGFSAAKTYDLEIWAPAAGKWLEVSSCSNFTDYQARRSNLRYKPAEGGKPQFVHTLNGSGLALPRLQVVLWESYQQRDGAIEIPEVLRKYMDGQERIQRPGR